MPFLILPVKRGGASQREAVGEGSPRIPPNNYLAQSGALLSR
jgi:hypothetical protein